MTGSVVYPETVKFYRALTVCGTDFSMMGSIFPNRARGELKAKFKREDRRNPGQISQALSCQTFDPMEEFPPTDDEEEETKSDVFSLPPKKGRRKSCNGRQSEEPINVTEEMSRITGTTIIGESPALEAFIKNSKKRCKKSNSEPKSEIPKGRPRKLLNQKFNFVPHLREENGTDGVNVNLTSLGEMESSSTGITSLGQPIPIPGSPATPNRSKKSIPENYVEPEQNAGKCNQENNNIDEGHIAKKSKPRTSPKKKQISEQSNLEPEIKKKRISKKSIHENIIKENKETLQNNNLTEKQSSVKSASSSSELQVKEKKRRKPKLKATDKQPTTMKPIESEHTESNACPEILRFDPTDPLGFKLVPIITEDCHDLSSNLVEHIQPSDVPSQNPATANKNEEQSNISSGSGEITCPSSSSTHVNIINHSDSILPQSTRRKTKKFVPKFRVPTGGGKLIFYISYSRLVTSKC